MPGHKPHLQLSVAQGWRPPLPSFTLPLAQQPQSIMSTQAAAETQLPPEGTLCAGPSLGLGMEQAHGGLPPCLCTKCGPIKGVLLSHLNKENRASQGDKSSRGIWPLPCWHGMDTEGTLAPASGSRLRQCP